MRKHRVTGLLVAASCAVLTAHASNSSGPGVPSFLIYQTNGVVSVYFLKSIRSGTIPTCAAAGGGIYYRLVFDSTTAAGKGMLAGLIAAHGAGEGVWPGGSGDCGVDGVNESLQSFTTAS